MAWMDARCPALVQSLPTLAYDRGLIIGGDARRREVAGEDGASSSSTEILSSE